MEKFLAVFTMKGCPHCETMKERQTESGIDFIDMDIEENADEYEVFSKITENDFVPAFMIMEIDENDEEKKETHLFAPGRDYEEIEDGIKIIKEHFN